MGLSKSLVKAKFLSEWLKLAVQKLNFYFETLNFQQKKANLGLKWVITKTAVTRLHPKRFMNVALKFTVQKKAFTYTCHQNASKSENSFAFVRQNLIPDF